MKTTDQELDFGIDSSDVNEFIKFYDAHKNDTTTPLSPKMMNDKQIRELWEKTVKSERGMRIHGDIPETYEEFYKKIKDSQAIILKEINHDS